MKRMGRPPLPAGKKRLNSMGFRPTPAIRAQITAAARVNRRSMTAEIESRLERTFIEDRERT